MWLPWKHWQARAHLPLLSPSATHKTHTYSTQLLGVAHHPGSLSVAAITTMTKRTLMENRIRWSYSCTSQCNTEGNQHRNARQEPIVRSWSNGGTPLTGFLLMAYSLLSCITQDCLPKGGTPPPQWIGPSHNNYQSKMPTGLSDGPQLTYLFPHDSSLCQTDKKKRKSPIDPCHFDTQTHHY